MTKLITQLVNNKILFKDDNFGTDASSEIVEKRLGTERRNRVLAGMYIYLEAKIQNKNMRGFPQSDQYSTEPPSPPYFKINRKCGQNVGFRLFIYYYGKVRLYLILGCMKGLDYAGRGPALCREKNYPLFSIN